jgi:mannosyl-glycoprotein endo-beta-N-acetylglucosaminidase
MILHEIVANRHGEVTAMKRSLLMLGISLLVAGGLLSFPAVAQSALSDRAQVSDQELIRDVQRQLKGLGFNPGAVDGNMGAQTVAALRAYQQAYRLPQTGQLDETTLRSILPERFEASLAPLDLSNREVLQQAQRQMKALGFDPGTMDGTFGPQTEAAVRAYQQAYRLPQTGRLDEVTLRSILPERFEASRTSLEPPNREVLRQAQRQLKALGFNPGTMDGTFGPQTEAALRAYQQAYRLPQTGRPDEVTLRSLLPEKREGALR